MKNKRKILRGPFTHFFSPFPTVPDYAYVCEPLAVQRCDTRTDHFD